VLRDGDTIFVPKAQIFYITGQVKNPGQYIYDTGMNVQQAMALAGGLTDRGSDRGIKIRRLLEGHEIELDARLETKIEANDTIIIRQRFF
jgi:polysaccharide export outer membrane protein